ncbi:MAG: DNA gyrase C-terminal beta-propeller domain-containing protein [Dissulfurimicrobium sp.]
MVIISSGRGTLMTVTENGYGKRTSIEEYRVQSRGGKGIINIKTTDKVGSVVNVLMVDDTDELMLVGTSGNIIRIRASDVRTIGLSTQGVRLIQLAEGDKLAAVAKLAEREGE